MVEYFDKKESRIKLQSPNVAKSQVDVTTILDNPSLLDSNSVKNRIETKQHNENQAEIELNKTTTIEDSIELKDDNCYNAQTKSSDNIINQPVIVGNKTEDINNYHNIQIKSNDDSINQSMIKLVKDCNLIYSKIRKSNQDIVKLMQIAESFRNYHYANSSKNEYGNDHDWFEDISNLTSIENDKIKLYVKLGTRLSMIQSLTDTKHLKEGFKYLDLELLANMSNLEWKKAYSTLTNTCKKHY